MILSRTSTKNSRQLPIRLPRNGKPMAERGTKTNPITLRSADGGDELDNSKYVLLTMGMVRILQDREPYDARPSNTHELHDNDPEIPSTQFNWKELDRRIFGTDTDFREVERLSKGRDTVDNKSF